ncbi:MAG: hypothetical protein P4L73_13430 [Caulobacteraceae bacterium]|nr:hypothetical protein [Caulobacteraceae bacterium]
MSGVTATISARVAATLSEAPPVGSASQVVNEAVTIQLSAGVGAGNADTLLTKALNIAASGNVTIDLTGSATDAFGATVALADVQAILVEADPTNTNNIVLGGAASTPWVGPLGGGNQTIAVKPGGVLLEADKTGWPVAGGSADILQISNSGSGTAVTGKITIIGRSA